MKLMGARLKWKEDGCLDVRFSSWEIEILDMYHAVDIHVKNKSAQLNQKCIPRFTAAGCSVSRAWVYCHHPRLTPLPPYSLGHAIIQAVFRAYSYFQVEQG